MGWKPEQPPIREKKNEKKKADQGTLTALGEKSKDRAD